MRIFTGESNPFFMIRHLTQIPEPLSSFKRKDDLVALSGALGLKTSGVTHGFWYVSECFVMTVSATIWIWDCLECGLPFLEPSDRSLLPLQSSDGGLRI